MRREPVKSWKERKWNGKYVNTAFIYEILKKKKNMENDWQSAAPHPHTASEV